MNGVICRYYLLVVTLSGIGIDLWAMEYFISGRGSYFVVNYLNRFPNYRLTGKYQGNKVFEYWGMWYSFPRFR
jgi:hypothetical protein